MSTEGFETISQMKLNHLPNDAKLILQRQKGNIIPKDKFQFGLPTTFLNAENNQTVWNRGPSIQLEQIPELIDMLKQAYEKYSEKDIKTSGKYSEKDIKTSGKRTTFADCIDD